MPTFIKTGYWEKLQKGYKGWLNLDEIISGAAITGSGTSGYFPKFNGTSALQNSSMSETTQGIVTISPSGTFNSTFILEGDAGVFYQANRYSSNSTHPRYELRKARGTRITPLVVQTNDLLGSLEFYGYDGSAFQRNGIIGVFVDSVAGSTINPRLQIGLGTSAPNNQYYLTLFNTGNFAIGGASDDLTNRLQVTGSMKVTGAATLSGGLYVTNDASLSGTSISLNNTTASGDIVIGNNNYFKFGATGGRFRGVGNAYQFQDGSFNTRIEFNASATGFSYFAAGNLAVGTATDVTSAQLQVTSTTKGFLPPRMTSAQKTTISTPVAGLVVYDTDLNKLCVYTGAAWQTITSA
jgi:hypothetical protein